MLMWVAPYRSKPFFTSVKPMFRFFKRKKASEVKPTADEAALDTGAEHAPAVSEDEAAACERGPSSDIEQVVVSGDAEAEIARQAAEDAARLSAQRAEAAHVQAERVEAQRVAAER